MFKPRIRQSSQQPVAVAPADAIDVIARHLMQHRISCHDRRPDHGPRPRGIETPEEMAQADERTWRRVLG